jgi:DNA-binding NtrC family response regulator
MIPRVVLALDRPTVQRQLKQRLAGLDLIVDVVKGKQRLWERLKREVCDLLVVSVSRIPSPCEEMVGLLSEVPDAPMVAVILEHDDPERRAQFLAAGCQAVLDTDVSTESMVDVLETLLEQRREIAQQRLAGAGLFTQPQLRDFVSNSPVMQAFLEVVQRVVNSTVSLLILGETGVGKERLARAVHNDGPRSGGPFIAINCGALPETLLESELFGHEEGAFTGATRSRRGCFEMAHGGTVFLDEIGELPHHLQVKLLRVLQDKEVRRLGGERSITVDVRIMAATNRDLEQAVQDGEFRRDLFYRLNVMTLTLPPLRERREDIQELATNYVAYLRPRIGCDVYGLTDEALAALCDYAWPGNVRELINVIERAMLLCTGDEITLAELPVTVSGSDPALASLTGAASAGPVRLPDEWLQRPWRDVRSAFVGQLERAYLEGLLQQTGGRIGETARQAGMEPRSLHEKMRRHKLRKEDYR